MEAVLPSVTKAKQYGNDASQRRYNPKTKTMKKLFALGLLGIAPALSFADATIVATDAYRWAGDTIYQNEFKAWAESPEKIVSTYKGRPGYFMPVEQTWQRRNNLSAYPRLKSTNTLHEAIFNMGLDEMVNAVEPDTTLRTGKEWAGVWTRDVSYSIILSMAALQPEASMISLMKKVNPSGQIIQDTGSGGAWPISTDRMVWVLAAWEIYKATGDKKWLETVYPIAVRSLQKDEKTVMSERGLVKGETSFIDWREQSYPRWMQTVDISQSEAMGTNVMYAAALHATADMARTLGKKKEAKEWEEKADALSKAINDIFWMADKGYYGMYTYGPENVLLNPRAETLGESLAILYDIADADRTASISQNNPHTPFGPAIFYPQISDMPNYHNNALWPFVASYWTLAQAKAGNEQGTLEGIGSVFRPAALFATNKENFNLDNGDYFTELNSSNMLWSLSGNLAITMKILFGLNYEKDGLLIKPFVPQSLAGTRSLDNISYRGATLNITVNGFGTNVKGITLNGKALDPKSVIPATRLKGICNIVVDMDNQPIPAMKVNNVQNLKAPLTPVAWLEQSAGSTRPDELRWNPIEYIGEYAVLRDGREVARTHATSFDASEPGVWQVVGIAADGTPSFASQPHDNRIQTFIDLGASAISKDSVPLAIDFDVPSEGEYLISTIYANGNGPVNTENKAAIRSIFVDGIDAGTMVMPQRGVNNWDDLGESNQIKTHLSPGKHTITFVYMPEDENMNITTNHAILHSLKITAK